jgi:hypothetical protein
MNNLTSNLTSNSTTSNSTTSNSTTSNQITNQINQIINYMHELKLTFDLIDGNQPDMIYLRLPEKKKLILLYLCHQWAQTKQTIDLTLSDNAVYCPICQLHNGTWVDCPACAQGYCLDCYINARIDGRGRALCLLCGVQLFDQDLTEPQMRAWVSDILAQNQAAVHVYMDHNN